MGRSHETPSELDLVPAEPLRPIPVDPRRGRVPVRRRRRGRASSVLAENAATTSLILGLFAFLLCGLLAPFAIMKGNEARRLARAARVATPAGATVGVVLGWITLAALAASLFVALLLVSSSVVVTVPR